MPGDYTFNIKTQGDPSGARAVRNEFDQLAASLDNGTAKAGDFEKAMQKALERAQSGDISVLDDFDKAFPGVLEQLSGKTLPKLKEEAEKAQKSLRKIEGIQTAKALAESAVQAAQFGAKLGDLRQRIVESDGSASSFFGTMSTGVSTVVEFTQAAQASYAALGPWGLAITAIVGAFSLLEEVTRDATKATREHADAEARAARESAALGEVRRSAARDAARAADEYGGALERNAERAERERQAIDDATAALERNARAKARLEDAQLGLEIAQIDAGGGSEEEKARARAEATAASRARRAAQEAAAIKAQIDGAASQRRAAEGEDSRGVEQGSEARRLREIAQATEEASEREKERQAILKQSAAESAAAAAAAITLLTDNPLKAAFLPSPDDFATVDAFFKHAEEKLSEFSDQSKAARQQGDDPLAAFFGENLPALENAVKTYKEAGAAVRESEKSQIRLAELAKAQAKAAEEAAAAAEKQREAASKAIDDANRKIAALQEELALQNQIAEVERQRAEFVAQKTISDARAKDDKAAEDAQKKRDKEAEKRAKELEKAGQQFPPEQFTVAADLAREVAGSLAARGGEGGGAIEIIEALEKAAAAFKDGGTAGEIAALASAFNAFAEDISAARIEDRKALENEVERLQELVKNARPSN